MLKLNAIFKIVVILFLSLLIPSFLSIFKISFDEYVAAERADVKGASVVRVQTVENKTPQGNSREQSILVDFSLPRIGSINNLSQKPFRFPKPVAQEDKLINKTAPTSFPVASSYPINKYIIIEDSGRGSQLFYFAYAGMQGSNITFINNNPYDMLDVRIEVKWSDGSNSYTSVYTAFEIKNGQIFYQNKSSTAEATIPYNPSHLIQSIQVTFRDNAGSFYSANL